MTMERKVLVSYTEGDRHISRILTGYEFSREEAEGMLDKIWRGGDEKELETELIKKSKWGKK